ncbi:uncharacterized protein ASPGLDRAFT_30077 [Aspergillus glaucus CBS 516.65]|uniref:Uncharacterized protein n=1 Tax=Aspergillus glaucus CBS 516.65 TaxID=1160497 RepID=A0A1L9V5G5_ASPGL|nr:hypothetical protein ASPGLDRAFT_30077 [Aspergillus glaucus CBS 516.65]OJJ79177.1 hypothetical protein ASPGLDRAFT_30077 [Aspergillus glaucus CBS 516.65]
MTLHGQMVPGTEHRIPSLNRATQEAGCTSVQLAPEYTRVETLCLYFLYLFTLYLDSFLVQNRGSGIREQRSMSLPGSCPGHASRTLVAAMFQSFSKRGIGPSTRATQGKRKKDLIEIGSIINRGPWLLLEFRLPSGWIYGTMHSSADEIVDVEDESCGIIYALEGIWFLA